MADVKDEDVQLGDVKDTWLHELLFRGAHAWEVCICFFGCTGQYTVFSTVDLVWPP